MKKVFYKFIDTSPYLVEIIGLIIIITIIAITKSC